MFIVGFVDSNDCIDNCPSFECCSNWRILENNIDPVGNSSIGRDDFGNIPTFGSIFKNCLRNQ